jgi:Holliday junction resolvase
MGSKTKGTKAERELIHKFWEFRVAAIRIAGSGSNRYPSADLIVGNSHKKMIIECKAIADERKYFDKEEIDQLQQFSAIFGAEALIALRFDRKPWAFLRIHDLEQTGKCYMADAEIVEKKSKSFEEIIQLFIK